MEKVAILVSTYNGEKYIKEQLDSLLEQTYQNIEIYIRDDGSTDNTIDIIKKYEIKNKNVHIIIGENIGYVYSFLELIKNCNCAQYYAYCDQDDIWEKQKIEIAVEKLKQLDNNKPNMFFHNVDCCNENMEFLITKEEKGMHNFRNSLVECPMSGMTMVINKNARDRIAQNIPKYCASHDWWTYMLCSGVGNLVFYNESLAKYRRHDNSVTASGKNILQIFLYRIKKFAIGGELKKIRKQYKEFYKFYKNDLPDENRKLIYLFGSEGNKIIRIIKKFFYPKKFRIKTTDEIIVRIMFLMGRL